MHLKKSIGKVLPLSIQNVINIGDFQWGGRKGTGTGGALRNAMNWIFWQLGRVWKENAKVG